MRWPFNVLLVGCSTLTNWVLQLVGPSGILISWRTALMAVAAAAHSTAWQVV